MGKVIGIYSQLLILTICAGLLNFIPYFIFELPSNIILRKAGSANWLSAIAFCWGVTMLGQGFVKSWISLTICRLLLGFFEAGRCTIDTGAIYG